jgi:hypothetical protein
MMSDELQVFRTLLERSKEHCLSFPVAGCFVDYSKPSFSPKVRKLAELISLGKNALFYKWFLDISFSAFHTEQHWFW